MADQDSKIPYGFCQCGCGRKTNLANQNNSKRGYVKGEPYKFWGHHRINKKGKDSPRWKGGRVVQLGYFMVKQPNHPRANSAGYVREHIIIAEKALGKSLPMGAAVHHANGTRNSGPLVVCQDNAYHKLIHARMRAFESTGDPHQRPCCFCKEYDILLNLRPHGGSGYCHPECYRIYDRKRHSSHRESRNAKQRERYQARVRTLGGSGGKK